MAFRSRWPIATLAPTVAVAMVLTACAATDADPVEPSVSTTAPDPVAPAAPQRQAQITTPNSDQKAGSGVTRQVGTGQFLNPAPATQSAPAAPMISNGDGDYSLNMVDVPIEQAARAVLGETLKLNYAVAPGVDGQISLQTSAPLGRAALFDTFKTTLELSGYTIVAANGTYTVARAQRGARRFQVGRGRIGPGGITVFPLAHISATEMLRILQPIASPDLKLTVSQNRNILFASGPQGEIDAVLDAVNLFDVDVMGGKSFTRVELLSARPSQVARELEIAFETGPGGSLEGVMSFLPNDQLGSILIISSRPEYASRAEAFIRQFEENAGHGTSVAAVYRLENREASELAPLLDKVLSFGGAIVDVGGAPTASGSTVTPGAGPSPDGAAGPIQARIVADDRSNSLIAYATPGEQRQIAKLIQRLDDVADQVLIEATIAEVTLTDDLQFGLRHFFTKGNFAANFSALAVAGTDALLPGFNAVFTGDKLSSALDALASITTIRVVSTPSLLVLDNHQAVLNVGDQVPVVTQSAVSITDPGAPIVNTVEQRDTGTILTITPRVSSSGRVILDIRQEVSDVVATDTSGIDSPTIRERIISTTVAVDSGQGIALGGLIREARTRSQDQVPLLGDLPVVGAAFRSTFDSDERTELLVLIQPSVIRDADEARQVTDQYRSQMSGPTRLLDRRPSEPRHQLERIFF